VGFFQNDFTESGIPAELSGRSRYMHVRWTHSYLCANSNRYISCGCVGTHFV